jgi:hypothetical protein
MRRIREQVIWYRTKRLAAAHPFFHRKNGLLSMREAKARLQGREIPDGHEVLRQARIELGIPEPVSGAATSPGKTFCNTVIRGHSFSLRRGLVCLSVLLIVFGFFTMTEAGAALAKGLYNVIISVFDGSLLSRNEGTTGYVKPIDFAALPAEFESLEAVAEATGRQVVIPVGSDDVLLSFSVHMVGNEALVTRSKYCREDGKQYTISQSLYNDSVLWSRANSTTEDSIDTIALAIGIKAYLSTMEDGTVYAVAFDTGHDINVISTMLSLEELKEVLLNIRYMD